MGLYRCMYNVGVVHDQERIWRETTEDLDDPAEERAVLRGGEIATNIDPQLYHDIQLILGRLVAKAEQLIDNVTTNLAESWMHIRSKFDGGKVVNRSQSGSWEHRSMGAGLQYNKGKEWGPKVWPDMTNSSPNKTFRDVAQRSARKVSSEKKRKAKDTVKQQRRRRKISQNKESNKGRKAYNRHDGGTSPDDIVTDLSPDELEEKKTETYERSVVVTSSEAREIEQKTRDQADSRVWFSERRKRLTASVAGSIVKMRQTTKKAKKVESLLYSKFKGNEATNYGKVSEEKAKVHYQTYQRQHGHSCLTVNSCGLFVSLSNPWLAATPDGLVNDPSDIVHPLGLVEIKNPYSVRSLTLTEASKKPSFCLKQNDNNSFQLKLNHDYYHQVQTQIYCTDRQWCDFVLRTDNDLHIERIYKDQSWGAKNLKKLKDFYFSALLPELAHPRHHSGGIREPSTH